MHRMNLLLHSCSRQSMKYFLGRGLSRAAWLQSPKQHSSLTIACSSQRPRPLVALDSHPDHVQLQGLPATRRTPLGSSSGAARRYSQKQQQDRQQQQRQHLCRATGEPSGGSGQSQATVLTLPTILTLLRVAAVPALVAAWFWSSPQAPAVCTALFVGASLTDWLDGYLARKMNCSSAFGAFLDPVADKLMVAAVLVLLSTRPLAAGPLAGNTWLLPALTLVIIGREITMSALREWAATLGPSARAAVAVNAWGKWKTASQMVSLTLLLLVRDGASGPVMEAAAAAGPVLLGVAAWLTAHSLAIYLKGLWPHMTS